jgi:hypothetical protein
MERLERVDLDLLDVPAPIVAFARELLSCQTYGITGFEAIGEDALGAAIKKYEQR